jgi:sigma-B regulation protein RsbU (phosphoserine phosphatase)
LSGAVAEPSLALSYQRALEELRRGEGDAARCLALLPELRQLLERFDRRLKAKEFLLQNLFDLSRELTSSFDEEAIKNVVTATLLGQLLASRCAFFEAVPGGYAMIHERGGRGALPAAPLSEADVRDAFASAPLWLEVDELAPGLLRERLAGGRLSHVLRLVAGGRDVGFFAVGGRASAAPLREEDCDFAMTLGRQALAALEAVRMHRMRLEKERQDRELQLARGIQQGLLPRCEPALAGFLVAARSESCYEIGGDYYDFIPLEDGRLSLVVADVSGKGTPASLLMASVHASLQALAGSVAPAALMRRLNHFLYLNTEPNKYVTLFYAELDPRRRQLAYVNAGHVPPFVLTASGARRRLEVGGPALGLLEDAAFEEGAQPLGGGDVVAVVTDGATEALNPEDQEFGDQRLYEALAERPGGSAQDALDTLFAGVHGWTGARGCNDDLTALVLRAC